MPAGRIGDAVPALGEEEWWRGHIGLGCLWLGGQIAADTFFLRRIAAQAAKVFAGASLDGQGLVAPGGAGAGINAADILENVRFHTGATDFDRFAIVQVRHDKSPRRE